MLFVFNIYDRKNIAKRRYMENVNTKIEVYT